MMKLKRPTATLEPFVVHRDATYRLPRVGDEMRVWNGVDTMLVRVIGVAREHEAFHVVATDGSAWACRLPLKAVL